MPLLAVPIVAVLALFLVIVGITIAYFYVARITKELDRLKLQLESSSMLMSEFSNTNQLLQNHVNIVEKDIKSITTEHSQVLKQLELRSKYLNENIVELEKSILQLQANHSQDKYYNRALNLAAKGASVEEIMNECELPRAEVEILLSVHK
jgi:septal ring factor EnvC (AmiA/AmiB activator)